MATARKLKSGNWNCRVYDQYKGKQISFTASTKKEAERQAALYQLTLKPQEEEITFEDAAEKYIISKENILSPNTIRDYRCSLKHHCYYVNKLLVSQIRDLNLQLMVNDLATEVSPKTVKNVYSFVTAVIRSVLPHSRFSVQLPKKVKVEMKMPSEADLRAILGEVRGTEMEVPVRMALNCCLRRGEISGILNHPECVSDNSVTVRYNVVKDGMTWIEKSPKTYTSYRTVPCPPDLVKLIRKTSPMNPGMITDHWIKMMRHLKMSYRFHDLRHASASMMLTIMPTVDVEKFGGWQHGSGVLQRIYTYNLDESLQKSAVKWQEKMKDFS